MPLPQKPDKKTLGESRSQAVRRFLTLEHSLRYKGQFEEVDAIIQEYFENRHAEVVPNTDREKPILHANTCHAQRIEHYHESSSHLRCISEIIHWCVAE